MKLLLLGMMLVVVGCGGARDAQDEGNSLIRVVTTVGMITDITRQVAGEHAEVKGLIGEGVDPHLYNPTRSDVAALVKADIIFYGGLMLEGRMTDVLERMAQGGKPVHAVTSLLRKEFLLDADDEGYTHDPHVWMDVSAWIEAVHVVSGTLSQFAPAYTDDFASNKETYIAQLNELHAYVTSIIETVPEDRRILITAHDAFNYFGRTYGLEVMGIQGLSTESEAGLLDINRLVDLIVERKISSVFVESSVAERNVRALIEGARARGHQVSIGGTLFSDAMGAPGTYEGTYIGMIDHNATVIARALGGEAPERGFQGKLSYE